METPDDHYAAPDGIIPLDGPPPPLGLPESNMTNMARGDVAMADMTNSFALLSGGGSPVGFVQAMVTVYPEATENMAIDPSLLDSNACSYALPTSPGDSTRLASPTGGFFLGSEAHVCRPPLTSQELASTDASIEMRGLIASTAGYPGMWLQQPPPSSQHPDSAIPLQATTNSTTPCIVQRSDSIWSSGSNIGEEIFMSVDSYQIGQFATVESTGGQGSAPDPGKGKRRRGRPRIYDNEGAEIPKRKPGRPITYTPIPDSVGSRSSNVSPYSLASNESSGTVNQRSSLSGSTRTGNRSASADGGDETTEQNADEGSKQAATRTRNKAAATRYRFKTQLTIERIEAQEREVSLRRQALRACLDRLREEVYELKTEIFQHANCGCPLINGYISKATQYAIGTYSDSTAIPISGQADEPPQQPGESWTPPGGVESPISPFQPFQPPQPFQFAPFQLYAAGCTSQQAGFVMSPPIQGSYHSAQPSLLAMADHTSGNVDGHFDGSMPSVVATHNELL